MKIFTRGALKRLGGLFVVLALGLGVFAWIYLRMAGTTTISLPLPTAASMFAQGTVIEDLSAAE